MLNTFEVGRTLLLAGFILTAQDKNDLLDFFDSLTDWAFICAHELQDPFGVHLPHTQCATPAP
jgi:cytochrome c peroxidase